MRFCDAPGRKQGNNLARETEFAGWMADYEKKRTACATCRFICSLGPDFGGPGVDFLTRATGAPGGLKLA